MSGEVLNTFLLLGVAAFNAVTAVIGFYTLRAAKKTEADVAEVKVHTNSMKDALVAAARKEGVAQGKASEEARNS